ncbi:MAG: hypothetical protein BWK72_19130 [Rhodoferax ferrireducens]|uniref:Uncharacterized protein n=1 Tax=Rhodoferax ferrireducens TaxID=192843 RepID=A0A1W9KQC0_9BURK|nr:MAG: hypothetical protein BWK72_19130 [Rhodoferax ferrireducens]
MKTVIAQTGDFVRQVEIVPISAQPGTYQLQFSSQLTSARNPLEWQRNFGLVLQKSELHKLNELINAVL